MINKITKEEAKAFKAFSKLLKFRKDWIGDWKHNLENKNNKYIIYNYKNKIITNAHKDASYPISFSTEKMCNEFFNYFKDLLEEAKTLL